MGGDRCNSTRGEVRVYCVLKKTMSDKPEDAPESMQQIIVCYGLIVCRLNTSNQVGLPSKVGVSLNNYFPNPLWSGTGCPGTQSDQAGNADACQGCPNKGVCSTLPKGPDPGTLAHS